MNDAMVTSNPCVGVPARTNSKKIEFVGDTIMVPRIIHCAQMDLLKIINEFEHAIRCVLEKRDLDELQMTLRRLALLRQLAHPDVEAEFREYARSREMSFQGA
jgi:hypothetical protein